MSAISDRQAALLGYAAIYQRVTEAAAAKVGTAARAFARAETLAYSKAHPRRLVTFCAAMGATDLTVQSFEYPGAKDYLYTASGDHGDKGAPAFLATLAKVEDDTGLNYPAGPYRLECRGGAVISELTHW